MKEWNGNHKPRKQQKEWRQRDQRQTYTQVVVKENKRRVQGVKAQGLVHVRVQEEKCKMAEKLLRRKSDGGGEGANHEGVFHYGSFQVY